MIRICHIADHLNGEVDGVYTHIKTVLKSTDSRKFEHFLCFQGNKKIEEEFSSLGGQVIILQQLSSKMPFGAILRFIWLCKKNNIQVIHSHFLKSYIIAGLSNIILMKKVIYNYHGLFIKNEFYNKFEIRLYQICHFLVCKLRGVQIALVPSRESMNQLLLETKLFPRIEQYYVGGTSNFTNAPINEDVTSKIETIKSFRFIFIGRIEEEKRLDRALNILYQLKNNGFNVHLFIFGFGSLKGKIVKLIEELKIKEIVSLLGAIPNLEVYLKYFDCLLLTSDREGMPFVIWESMSHGLPILSSSVGGITEVVNDSKCGLLFSKDNILEAVEKAQRLINNRELQMKLGLNGRRAIIEKYSLINFKIFIENLYYSLTKRRNAKKNLLL